MYAGQCGVSWCVCVCVCVDTCLLSLTIVKVPVESLTPRPLYTVNHEVFIRHAPACGKLALLL